MKSVKKAWEFINATDFSNQVTCYYVPEKLNFESQNNSYLLIYNRDDLYATYVALAVVGSVFLAVAVASCIGAIIGCKRTARKDMESTANKDVPLSST